MEKSKNSPIKCPHARNSVEHFYPRHPTEIQSIGDDKVEYFGNLALLSREINSKFSNLTPRQKIEYPETKTGSLKLRLMSNIVRESEKEDGYWIDINNYGKDECTKHGKEMLDILEKEVNGEKRIDN